MPSPVLVPLPAHAPYMQARMVSMPSADAAAFDLVPEEHRYLVAEHTPQGTPDSANLTMEEEKTKQCR